MDFRDDLSADLPSPRDDEPASLRDDIVDELADHLACMYRRELLRGTDASSAKARVLERFGDPADLARRLWFDAMKGKIMSQRILVSCCILLTFISLALAGALWMQAIDFRRMMAMEARAALVARQAQEAQEQMLKQLAAVSKAVENPRSPDWIPVSFKLTQQTLDGPPAVNLGVSLGRGNNGSNKHEAIHRQSDANGRVDLGVVQPGDWEYRLTYSSGMVGRPMWSAVGTLNVVPGAKVEKAIVCPSTPLEQVTVKPRVEWPSDLASKDLLVAADFGHEGWSYQPSLHWSAGGFLWNVLCGPSKEQARSLSGRPLLWRLAPSGDADRARSTPIYADAFVLSSDQSDEESVALEPGTYQLHNLVILKPTSLQVKRTGGVRFEVAAFTSSQDARETIYLYNEPLSYSRHLNYEQISTAFAQDTEVGVPMSRESLKGMVGSFLAEKGSVKEWIIKLPDELVKAVREKLKMKEQTKRQ